MRKIISVLIMMLLLCVGAWGDQTINQSNVNTFTLSAGEIITFEPDEYLLTRSLPVESGVKYRALLSGTVTINGQNSIPIFQDASMITSYSERIFIEKLNIFNGKGDLSGLSGGVSRGGYFEVTDCRFIANNAVRGGVAINGRWYVNNTSFELNTASDQAGVFYSCEVYAENAKFISNSAVDGGVSRACIWFKVHNCLFAGNEAASGGVSFIEDWYDIRNSTFIGNISSVAGDIAYDCWSWDAKNCIFTGGSGVSGNMFARMDWDGSFSVLMYSYIPSDSGLHSSVYLEQSNIIGSDAGLDSNYALLEGSACIDSGDDTVSVPNTDIAGNLRRVGVIDMGAYEYQGNPIPGTPYAEYESYGEADGTNILVFQNPVGNAGEYVLINGSFYKIESSFWMESPAEFRGPGMVPRWMGYCLVALANVNQLTGVEAGTYPEFIYGQHYSPVHFYTSWTETGITGGAAPTISLFNNWGVADEIGTFIVKRGASEGTAVEIGKLKLNVAALELTAFATATTESMESMITMTKSPEGKPMVTVTGSLAEEINSANAIAPKSVWVTASFTVDGLYPIILNGEQMSDSKGNVFPQYANYLGDITYNAGEVTFRIYHFSEWSIPQLEAKTFAGTHDDDSVVANGASIEVLAGGQSQINGSSGQDTTTPVEKISGLAYATVLNDIQKVGDIYKPMDPSDPDYSVHFGYINRGNATDNFGIVAEMVSDNEGHFGYTIAVDNKDVAPWQIVSFSISVTNSAALAFERATLNVTVNIVGDAVSYNAFAGAISTTFGDDGVYGGLDDLSYSFTFETEGYSLKVLNRVATINSPLSDGQFIPGAKVKYEIVIKNESAAVATDVRIKDVIPANTHLYYLDGVTENQNVVGALNDVWSILSVTDNSAADVEYQFSIPANETVTASYTVTVD